MRIIFGWHRDYEEIRETHGIATLSARREKEVLKFAIKQANSDRFRAWFPRNDEINRDLRRGTRNVFKEPFARTERFRNNPLIYMIRKLNENEH